MAGSREAGDRPFSGAAITLAALTGLAVASLTRSGARSRTSEGDRAWETGALAQARALDDMYRRAEQHEARTRHQAVTRRLRQAGATRAVYHVITDAAGYSRHDCTRDTEADAEAEGEAWLEERVFEDPDGAEEYSYWVEREDVPVRERLTIRGPQIHPQISRLEAEKEAQTEEAAHEDFLHRLPR